MKRYLLIAAALVATLQVNAQTLTKEIAEKLSEMPVHCIGQEFPNKTGHAADSAVDARLMPSELHPAFYGCFDWHSSVHGHWVLVRLLKSYPDIANRTEIIDVLSKSFTLENMQDEAAYFSKYSVSSTFERTYGWAWLLKLDEELATWNDPIAQKWHQSMQPLTQKIVELWRNFLPKQTYPNRTGVHPNTAFGLVFALDWARATRDTAFERQIVDKALYFYKDNEATPAYMEPDGSDFFSPSLEVADLMRRVMPKQEFITWFDKFYEERSLQRICDMPVVSDRSDYQIVHLDGLSFSRAWCMKGIANDLPANHPNKKRLNDAAKKFLDKTLPEVFSGNYGGSHWLASFAVYALQ